MSAPSRTATAGMAGLAAGLVLGALLARMPVLSPPEIGAVRIDTPERAALACWADPATGIVPQSRPAEAGQPDC